MGQPKTKKTKNQVQLPKYLENAYKGVLKAGANVAAAPLQQYTGPRQAGFTPDQYTGMGMIRNAQGAALPFFNSASSMYGKSGSMFDNASSMFGGATNLDWGSTMGGTTDPSGVNFASGAVMPGVDRYDSATMAQYMDPYMDQMIDPIMERMHYEDAKQISNLKGSGIAGFGVSPSLGDRMGLAASDLSGQQALSRNQTMGQLMSQGFQNAQGQLNAQQQLQLQGGTSDQQRLMEAQALMQQGRQADAERLLSSLGIQQTGRLGAAQGQLGAAQGQTGVAAGMQDLGTASQNSIYQGIDYMMNSGQMQQAQGQQQLDQAYADWQQRNNYAKDQTDWLANLIYGSPGKAATNTTTKEPGPSILSQLLGLGTTAVGLGKTFGQPSSRGGPVRFRDLGGAVVAPQIDPNWFRVPYTDLGGAPMNPGLNLGGVTYINALAPLTESMLGSETDLTTKLPKNVRRPFKHISRGIQIGNGSGNGNGGGKDVKDKGNTFFADLLGTAGIDLKKLKKKAIGGGLLPETDEPVPGTPEYDAALAEALSNPRGTAVEEPAYTGEVTGSGSLGDPGVVKRSKVGDFFSKVNPLVYAGLGIMGGESPFPLTNVGQGGAAGLKMAQDLYAMELDDKPMVDDSGPTIRIWTAGEGWTDTGIPSNQYLAVQASANRPRDETEKEGLMRGKYGPEWRSNPEAIKEMTSMLNTPQTRIDMGGSSEYNKGMGTNFSDYTKEVMITNPTAAQAKAQDYTVIAGLLSNPEVYTGTAGPAINSLKRAAGTLFGLDVEGVADAEVADMTKKAAIGGIRDILKGPMSDGDRATLEAIIPGLENSPEGIQLATEIAKMNATAANTKSRALGKIIQKNGGELTQEAYMEYQDWLEANPVYTEESLKAAQARAKAKTTPRGPAAGAGDALGAMKEKWGLD